MPVTHQVEVLHQGGEDQTPVEEELIILALSSPACDLPAVRREDGSPAHGLPLHVLTSVPDWQPRVGAVAGVLLARTN